MEKLHGDLFTDEENTQTFGTQLKKGVIYAEFDKGAMAIKSARREKAWKFFSLRTY